MAEPWLDSLSEGWQSQPGSSSPVTAAIGSKDATSANENYGSSKSDGHRKDSLPRAQLGDRALRERSNSAINIAHSSLSTSPIKSTRSVRSKLSSTGSTLQYDSVQRRTRSSSPPKGKDKTATPDWKKLVMRGNKNTCGRQDLFSPMRLEGIFRPSGAPSREDEDGAKMRTSLFGGMIDLPSSPPSLPSKASDSEGQAILGDLEVVQEQDEDVEEQSSASNAVPGAGYNPTPHLDQAAGISSPVSSVSSNSQTRVPNVESKSSLATSVPGHMHGIDEPTTLAPPAKPNMFTFTAKSSSTTESIFKTTRLPLQTQSRSGSSIVGTFSPVFVSKHKTAEGLIDYSALDLSDPKALSRLQNSYPSSDNTDSGPEEVDEHELPEHMLSAAKLLREVPESPLSSSVVPSDSVSQIHIHSQRFRPKQPPASFQFTFHARPTTPPQRTENQLYFPSPAKSPGSPLKLFGNHDTFTNGRLLSRMTQLHEINARDNDADAEKDKITADVEAPDQQSVTSVETAVPVQQSSATNAAVMSQSRKQEALSQHAVEKGDSPLENGIHTAASDSDSEASDMNTHPKRAGPELLTHSRTKRQRTLDRHEAAHVAEQILHYRQQQSQPQTATAQLDNAASSVNQLSEPITISTNADTVQRPRNPSPGQALRSLDDQTISRNSNFAMVQEHIQHAVVPRNPLEAAKIKKIATNVASFQIKGLHKMNGSIRKQSVSTQDYLDEATRIMDAIRSKRQIQDMSNDEEEALSEAAPSFHWETDRTSVHTVSRPPSREGRPSAWRNVNHKADDAQVQNYLQQYQEVGDEPFMASSVRHSPQNPAYEISSSADYDDSANIRIIDLSPMLNQPSVDDGFTDSRAQSVNSPVKTHSSNTSTDSTGRTVLSKSSGRTRTLPVIAPGNVSHLINSIESTSGMHFDRERQVWRKQKSRPKSSRDTSSSVETEDDPFSNISDLSIQETAPADTVQDVLETGSNSAPAQQKNGDEGPLNPDVPAEASSISSVGDFAREDDLQQIQAVSKHDLRGSEFSDPEEESSDTESVVRTPHKDSSLLGDGLQYDRRDISVMFSSPPVSREYPPQCWGSDSQGSSVAKPVVNARSRATSSELSVIDAYLEEDDPTSRNEIARRKNGQAIRQISQSLSLSRIDERHQLSFVSTTPGGRCLSLTLAVSTPLPAHRNTSVALIHAGDPGLGLALHSLSPLSDFTIAQDDGRHLSTRQLAADHQLVFPNKSTRNATVVDQLVKVLTDIEPDEPYWDSLRVLDMKEKQLQNVHGLCSFCPGLEDVDIGLNQLEQFSGIPAPVRYLNAAHNQLNCLTSWSNMPNLQYLDISNNNLETLDGLSNLLHLRELRADNNRITNVEGVFDLDALLSLSVSGNLLQTVDFRSADLRRLAKLDVSKNGLVEILGLEALPALCEIDASCNSLKSFPSHGTLDRPCEKLSGLRISHNELKNLNVTQLPSLQTLDAEHNHLSSIDGMQGCKYLRTVNFGNQTLLHDEPNTAQPSALQKLNPDIAHLHLSGSSFPTFAITTSFLNLQTLDLSFAGLHTLPANFGTLALNLRTVNLNANTLKGLGPLRGIVRLKQLYVAGNRLSRLRKTIKQIAAFKELEMLDLRDNAFTMAFYSQVNHQQSTFHSSTKTAETKLLTSPRSASDHEAITLRHLLLPQDQTQDTLHVARLDEDTALRRRVYELLLSAKCKSLRSVDGLVWDPERVVKKDGVWERLVGCGVVERVESWKIATDANNFVQEC